MFANKTQIRRASQNDAQPATRRRLAAGTVLAMLLCAAGCMGKGPTPPPFPPVTDFELNKYLGLWYEIARLPNRFERGMTHVTAEYALRSDGKVRVTNRGRKDGEIKVARGKAKFAGPSDVGHLLVSFFWIFYSDYVVIELDPDYRYALVSGADAGYLWILSRTPTLEQSVVERLVSRADSLGFDTDNLYFTPQDDVEGSE